MKSEKVSPETRLSRYLRERLEKTETQKDQESLSVGVEHEFFLFSKRGDPTSLEQSQSFLKMLSDLPGWRVFSTSASKNGSPRITRVSRETGGRYTAVKYEYPPHLLEVAFSYHSDLSSLSKDIHDTWKDLQKAALSSGTEIHSMPLIDPNLVPSNVETLEDTKLSWLAASRRETVRRSGKIFDPMSIDFPASMAATQVHIGGTNWWKSPLRMSTIYKSELEVQGFSYLMATSSSTAATALANKRWALYSEVFGDLQLLGYPNLPDWTFESWVAALCRTPLISDPGNKNFHRTFQELEREDGPNQPLDLLCDNLRDLQIIKPKLIGTIEFRADPAAPGPEYIFALAAMRLGQVLLAIDEKTAQNEITFADARTQWWRPKGEQSFSTTTLGHILGRISDILKTKNYCRKNLGLFDVA